MSFVRTHFCDVVARGFSGAGAKPIKIGLNGTIPAMFSKMVGSSGTKLALGRRVWFLDSKKDKKASRISLDVILFPTGISPPLGTLPLLSIVGVGGEDGESVDDVAVAWGTKTTFLRTAAALCLGRRKEGNGTGQQKKERSRRADRGTVVIKVGCIAVVVVVKAVEDDDLGRQRTNAVAARRNGAVHKGIASKAQSISKGSTRYFYLIS